MQMYWYAGKVFGVSGSEVILCLTSVLFCMFRFGKHTLKGFPI